MKYYIEINISKHGKPSIPAIMNELIGGFHKALVETGVGSVGLSFPDYGENLGNTLRLHGSLENLQKLHAEWGIGGTKRLKVSPMLEVPSEVTYRTYHRVRPSKQNSKLKAGLKSGHITDAKEYRKKMFSEVISLPFYQANSSSTNQSYKLFIGMSDSHELVGVFDSHGLSKSMTVPHF